MVSKYIRLEEAQTEIETFFNRIHQEKIPGNELRDWIVKCTVHFSTLGVNEFLIQAFLKDCEFQEDKWSNIQHGIFKFRGLLNKSGYTLKESWLQGINPRAVAISAAISVSRKLLERARDDERIIPKTIVDCFNSAGLLAIASSLADVETKFQQRDAKGMMSPLVSATELILKLIPELRNERGALGCIKKLGDDAELTRRYGINADIIWAMNCARIIRNTEVVHPNVNHNSDIKLLEGVAYAHLLVILADGVLASGNAV